MLSMETGDDDFARMFNIYHANDGICFSVNGGLMNLSKYIRTILESQLKELAMLQTKLASFVDISSRKLLVEVFTCGGKA